MRQLTVDGVIERSKNRLNDIDTKLRLLKELSEGDGQQAKRMVVTVSLVCYDPFGTLTLW